LELAHELDLPVVIHSREANQEVFDTILYSDVRKGVIHSFSGDWKLALRYVELGFHIGISGVVTFDKTNQLQSAVKEIPLDRILMETDCPYLTPAPHRSKRNDSTMLSYVAEAIAQIKGTTVETVCTQTMQNVGSLFGL
jgi:TatD DNase family protein